MTLADLPVRRDVPAVSAAQMAEADRITIEDVRLPVEVLMESASRQIAAGARAYLGSVAGKRIAAFVGTGNNGGDAVGALRHLANWGAVVHALVVGTRERLRETTNLQIARLLVTTDESRSGRVTNVGSRWSNFEKYVEADLLIDGLLGYNARGAPRDEVAVAIGAAARTSCPILAVDIPSGIDPDTGEAHGVAIGATLTVTLALPKRGLLAQQARPFVGELLVADIGIPHMAFERIGIKTRGLFDEGDLTRVAL